ncbi:MAG: Hsp20/alpha crystallin family protein [bacterium]|nr:Hsp20/alpha crystallin family protein [bacterium]
MKKEEQKKGKPSFAKASSYAKATEDKSEGKDEISLDDIPFVGGLLKGLGKFIDLAERAEEVGGELKRSGRISARGGSAFGGKGFGGRQDIHGVYGFTVRTGLGQRTKVEPFGNIKKTKEGPKVSETREPIVDVFDEKDHILIIAELPGIDEKSIKVDLKKSARHSPEAKPMAGGDILLFEADSPRFAGEAGSNDRKYAKEILLPAKVDFESREMNFKNGILELKLTKTK